MELYWKTTGTKVELKIENGNVLWGIDALDEARNLIPQADLPEQRANNMGKNKFYGLPFLLIILGAIPF